MPALEDIKVRVAVLIAAIIPVTIGVWTASGTVSGIRRDIAELKADSLTIPRACELALRMAVENPGVRVPDPRDPSKVIVVRPGSVSPMGGAP